MDHIEVKIQPSFSPGIQIRFDAIHSEQNGYYRLTATSPPPSEEQLPEKDDLYKVVELDIPESEIQEKLKSIEETQIPAVPEFTMGVDGTTYELNIGSGFNSVYYHWWGDPPKGWEPFASLVKWLMVQLPTDLIIGSINGN